MNKFKFYFILLITTVFLFSCSKNDDDKIAVEPPRDYKTQYDVDIIVIEEYLNTYYLNMDFTDPNFADQDIKIEKITDPATQPSIMSYSTATTTYPRLLSKTVTLNSVEYKLYYLVLREGEKDAVSGLGGDSPCNVDGVLASYKGTYLYRTVGTESAPSAINPVLFEEVTYPNDFLSLFETITGWGEVFPEFKTGTYKKHEVNGIPDGTIDYSGFGAGVMFLPSGLAYYNTAKASIPAYSPLVFSFKLYDIQRLDQDNDGIPSYLEDLNNDGYMRVLPATDMNQYVDDTDKDGIPNFYDVDDDGDNYTTKLEIKNPATGLPYPFADIPTTCTPDKKIHLDITCHP